MIKKFELSFRMYRSTVDEIKQEAQILSRSLVYLGHKLSATGQQPTSERIKTFMKASTPTTVDELQLFSRLI